MNLITWEDAVIWLRNSPDKKQLVSDCYFDDPVLDAAKRYHSSNEFQEILKLLDDYKPGKLLDVASGRGIAAYAFSQEGWDVTVIEPDKSSLVGMGAICNLIQTSGYQFHQVNSSVEETTIASNSFDVIFVRQGLHHAKNLKKYCSQLFRLLKPNGKLIAAREHVIFQNADLDTFLNSHPLHHLYGGEMAYTLEEYIDAITSANFKLQKILYPYDSDINLFPDSQKKLRLRLNKFKKYEVNNDEFNQYIKKWNKNDKTPGIMYSFVGIKE